MTEHEKIMTGITDDAPLIDIALQRCTGRGVKRDEAALAKFALADHQAIFRQVVATQGQCFRDAQTCRGQQSEQRVIGLRADRGQSRNQ